MSNRIFESLIHPGRMLHGVPWFLLGSLWALLFCEYRGFRKRLAMAAHIRTLETELMHAEDRFLGEQVRNDRVRAELLDLLAAVQSARRPVMPAAE